MLVLFFECIYFNIFNYIYINYIFVFSILILIGLPHYKNKYGDFCLNTSIKTETGS